MLCGFSHVRLCDTMDRSHCQASLSLGILQERILKWLAIPTPGDLSHPGIEPESLMSSVLAGGFFTTSATWEAPILHCPHVPAGLKCWLFHQKLYAFQNFQEGFQPIVAWFIFLIRACILLACVSYSFYFSIVPTCCSLCFSRSHCLGNDERVKKFCNKVVFQLPQIWTGTVSE